MDVQRGLLTVGPLRAMLNEGIPGAAFDLSISEILGGNEKVLANVRTSDAVGVLKKKLEALTGTEADALRIILVVDGGTQVALDIETQSLEEYGVKRSSRLMWQPQNPADAKQRRVDREAVVAEAERLRAEAERVRAAKRVRAEAERVRAKFQAKIRVCQVWACLLVCGAAVSQAGWWSLYGDLGLWAGVIGLPMALVGAIGFTCSALEVYSGLHSARWEGFLLFIVVVLYAVCGIVYVIFGAIVTLISAHSCPVTHTVPANGDPEMDDWVLPEAASAKATAGGREYGWSDRFEAGQGDCGIIRAIFAGLSLVFLLFALCAVCDELAAMRRAADAAARPPRVASA